MATVTPASALYGNGPKSGLGNAALARFDPAQTSPQIQNPDSAERVLKELRGKAKEHLQERIDIENKARQKLKDDQADFGKAMQKAKDSSRKFYEQNTPEMLGPELEKLYQKEFGPRRPEDQQKYESDEPEPEKPKAPEPTEPSSVPMS